MRNFLLSAAALLAALALSACSKTQLRSGADPAAFDPAVRPGDDFFHYVNGNWIRTHPIPPEYSRWGSFAKLRDDNLTALHAILDDLDKPGAAADAQSAKLRNFYHSAMDERTREAQGAAPLAPEFDRIAQIASRADVIAEIAHLRAAGIGTAFSLYVGQDEKQSDHYIMHLDQGGLSLPEREYYLSTTDDSQRIRTQYRDHITAMLALLGDSPDAARRAADAVLALETRLAQVSRTPVQLRDAEANYNKLSLAELTTLAPNLPWADYVQSLDLPDVHDVVVGQPEFFTGFSEALAAVSPDDWKAYFRWHLIHALAPYLSSAFENENFRFFSQTLRGVKEMQPRWKRALGTLDRQMGEALGRLYVDRYFPPQAKQRMDALVKNLLTAYAQRIATREWMSPETRQQALIKLAAINTKIGYPAKWRDYSALEITGNAYVLNVLRALAFESRYRLARLGKPVDRTDWYMTPPTVNAYYDGTLNEIVFPAGILQPPFFDPAADDAVNYGAIGAVIGHEITHGFDDQGSRMDAQGNLKNWWTPDDRARFTAKTDKFVQQYDACVAIDGLHVNGKLTLGEDLADLGGVTIAYAAYQASLHGQPAPVIDGFTGPQRFFIGYAQVWRDAARDAELKVALRTDPHAPARFRTLVPLSNFQPFYDAFHVQPGDAMYRKPEDRVEVW